jgi:hypothetical protein
MQHAMPPLPVPPFPANPRQFEGARLGRSRISHRLLCCADGEIDVKVSYSYDEAHE